MPAINYTFGWHPSAPDINDLMYKAPAHIVASIPDCIDLSQPAMPAPFEPAWDQEDIGSCGPNSASEDIVFSQIKQEGLKKIVMPSRLFIYYNTRKEMGTVSSDSGVDNRSMLKSLNKVGWCDEELWPYDTRKFTKAPPQAAYDQAATRKITGYARVDQDPQTMLACLANGDTFIFGFNVYSSMLTPQVDATGIIPMPKFRDRRQGGHDVLFVGYNNTTRQWQDIPPGHFKLKNHWTAQWGNRGYGYIPIKYATDPDLADDFWTITHSALPIDAPVPTPSPSPSPVPDSGYIERDLGFALMHTPAKPGDSYSFLIK